MLPGDEAIVTGTLIMSPSVLSTTRALELGELVQIIEVDDFVNAALVWGADSGIEQWIGLESLTPLGALFGGFLEGNYEDE